MESLARLTLMGEELRKKDKLIEELKQEVKELSEKLDLLNKKLRKEKEK